MARKLPKPFTEEQKARNRELRLSEIWSDASFFFIRTKNRAGNRKKKRMGAAFLDIGPDENLRRIYTFKLEPSKIQSINNAELLICILAMEHMQEGKISRLINDSTNVVDYINKVKSRKNTQRVPGPAKRLYAPLTSHEMYVASLDISKEIPQNLRQRLKSALGKHPHIEIVQLGRNEGHNPIADRFAREAAFALKDMVDMNKLLKGYNVPLTHTWPDGKKFNIGQEYRRQHSGPIYP